MTLIEWRKDPHLLKLAEDVLSLPTMQDMLNVLRTEHPGGRVAPVKDGFEATLALGQQQGFQVCLAVLQSLSVPLPKEPNQVRATWGAEEQVRVDQRPPMPSYA